MELEIIHFFTKENINMHEALPKSRYLLSVYDTRQMPFYTRQSLCRDILSAEGFLPSTYLPSVEKHSSKKNTRQIKNRNPKNSKTFF
jgi:hypothetical protein